MVRAEGRLSPSAEALEDVLRIHGIEVRNALRTRLHHGFQRFILAIGPQA